MSRDQGPGVSMYQGAENLSLEINGKSPEEEEDIEDENRRKEELDDLLISAFDDLNTDDDNSVANSSHYSGASHPHEIGTECEHIQPSISPCEVDYNKVIEFERNHRTDDTGCSSLPNHSLYNCSNTSVDSHHVSSTSHPDTSGADSSSHEPPPPLHHTATGRKKAAKQAQAAAKHQARLQHQNHHTNHHTEGERQPNPKHNHLDEDFRPKHNPPITHGAISTGAKHQTPVQNATHGHFSTGAKHTEAHAKQVNGPATATPQREIHAKSNSVMKTSPGANPQQHREQFSPAVAVNQQHRENFSPGANQNFSPGGVVATPGGQNQDYVTKFKTLEKQYEKRVREIEELRHYIQQLDSKFDSEKVKMEKILLDELSDKVQLSEQLKCSEEEKKRVQTLEREIQELRDNVNSLVQLKETTSKELDVSKITIYDLTQKIHLLETKKNVSKSMKSYERIIEQLKTDYEKQEKYYQSVQNKVLSEFERLKGELEKIRTEKDKMAAEINRSVDFIRTKLLDDPNIDLAKLKEMEGAELVEGGEGEEGGGGGGGFSVIQTLQQFLRMKQSDFIKSLKTCNNRPIAGPGGDTCDTPSSPPLTDASVRDLAPTQDSTSEPDRLGSDPAVEDCGSTHGDSPTTEAKALPTSVSGSDNVRKDTPSSIPTTPTGGKSAKSGESIASVGAGKVAKLADSTSGAPASGKTPRPSETNLPAVGVKASGPPVGRTSDSAAKNNNLAELNSILLDRLKKRESQLKSMTLECLNLSEVHFDSMKDVMNDFVRFHFAESLRIVSKPPKNASSKTIETLIETERRKDDLLKEFLDNFRNFIQDKKKEKLSQIREIQSDGGGGPLSGNAVLTEEEYGQVATSQKGESRANGDAAPLGSTTGEEDEQLLFDLKKMKNSFVNEINIVREELLHFGKENESLRTKCEVYEKKNKSVMDELKALKSQMGEQQTTAASDGGAPSNNKKKGKSKSGASKCNTSVAGSTVPEEERGEMNLTLPDSTKPEDLAKLEKSLDMKLMYEKNELLKALNRAHNEIKTKESLLQRMECDYYDKILEIEQHSVDLYAEEVQKIETSRSKQLMCEVQGLKDTLKESVDLVRKQKNEIRELRLRDTLLSMENERLHKMVADIASDGDSGDQPAQSSSQSREGRRGETRSRLDETGGGEEGEEEDEEDEEEEEEEGKDVSASKIDRIRYRVKFQQEYEKLREVCRQWSDEVRDLRSRLSATEKNLDAFRIKYKSIRKSALGYKKLAAEREKRLVEEKEAHKAHLDEIQVKMAKTIHKREAEINAKIAEIEKSNNEKLKVIMMLQRTAECSGAVANMNNNSGKNNVKYSVKYSDNLASKSSGVKSKKCSNETVESEQCEATKAAAVVTNGDVEEVKNNSSKKNSNSKVLNNNKVAANGAGDRKVVVLKKKKTEL